MARYKTIREAAQAWVKGFDRVPRGILEKLFQAGSEDLREITPPSVNDRVYVYWILGRKRDCNDGEIIGLKEDKENNSILYTIRMDNGEKVTIKGEDFEVIRDSAFPMWGALWAFSEQIDNDWVESLGGLQAMADCGFRIYEQEDYQYIFGIDGAGYDFYQDHWLPLYKARGLKWHEIEEDVK